MERTVSELDPDRGADADEELAVAEVDEVDVGRRDGVAPAVEAEDVVGKVDQSPAFDVGHLLTHRSGTLKKRLTKVS